MELIKSYLPQLQEYALLYSVSFIKAIAIFVIGKFVVRIVASAISKRMEREASDGIMKKIPLQ